MISEDLIREQGGKFGALTYLKERVPGLPIPAYEVIRSDQLDSTPVLRPPLIVRSSHSAEFWGMAGLLESVSDVDRSSVRRAIRQIEESFRNPDLQKYALQRGIDLGDHFYVGIQEQSRSRYNGSVMRHPNNPNLVYVNFSLGEGYDRKNWFFEYRDGKLVNKGREASSDVESEIRKVLDFYQQIESSELMPGYSLQVEFGLDPVAIYQARPFKKIETTDFKLPKTGSRKLHRPQYVFGITGPEGVVLPIARSYSLMFMLTNYQENIRDLSRFYSDFVVQASVMSMRNIDALGLNKVELIQTRKNDFIGHIKEHHRDVERDFPDGYALVIDEAHREPYLLDVSIPGMRAFVCGRGNDFLTHSVFRQMQNSDLSLLGLSRAHGELKTRQNVRIISNGKEAVLLTE